MKKVLVTGGAGFIGSHTVDLLLQQNTPVRVLDNLSSGFRHNLPVEHDLLEFIEGDICDASIVDQCMKDVSHCLNLAAQVSVVNSLADPAFSAQQNILGFVNVISSAHKHNIDRLVYASSAAIYGEPSELPLTESAPMKQLSPYGLEKAVNEQYAELFHYLYGLSSQGQRFFNVYGPRQDPKSPYAGVIALFADRISNQQPVSVFGDGEHTRDFIYISDVAKANIAALRATHQGACNIATGSKTSLLDLIQALSELANFTPQIDFLPPREGDIIHSLASPATMNEKLRVIADTTLKDGLSMLLHYHKQNS
ncbi:MAG: NAD-dependent epimerase/dehydratase family protein [Gammaproteobacteria bacterium]|nr:NAD-dependent epimerase/dehydratase family protein [Gammaproteobacteria bacterium]